MNPQELAQQATTSNNDCFKNNQLGKFSGNLTPLKENNSSLNGPKNEKTLKELQVIDERLLEQEF